jgi:hypothetical protein
LSGDGVADYLETVSMQWDAALKRLEGFIEGDGK